MSPHTSVCPIKGAARFFHVRAGDALNVNAAWTYPAPTPDAEGIRVHRFLERRGRCLADWTDDFADSHAGAEHLEFSCPPRASSAAGICPAP